jgi:hypothetical protein
MMMQFNSIQQMQQANALHTPHNHQPGMQERIDPR